MRIVAALSLAVSAAELLLDDRLQAHTFEGVGALSAGASSRLLWDYELGARNQILDLLFKPDYGASLHMLKVEIGGDTQSGDGAEASHERRKGEVDCGRGYETWLLKEAKKRNPEILTYGLSWGVPGWVGDGSFFSADNVRYQLDWMSCMKEAGVDVDYLGIWNEKPWGNVDYTLQLRAALDAAGFGGTELVMLDNPLGDKGFDEALTKNETFRKAVSAAGLHYPCDSPQPAVFENGKRLWASEEASVPATWGGAGCWGRVLNQNYLRMNITLNVAWSLVWSAYSNTVCFGNGLMYAFQPWSGRFSVNTPVWVTAHTTQFTKPGWRYLLPGSQKLSGGGTMVALTDGKGNLTVVVETLQGKCLYHEGCFHDIAAKAPQALSFRVGGGFAFLHLECWLTNETHHFVRMPDVAVVGGAFALTMPVDAIVTLTSPGNGGRQSKANGELLPPATDAGTTAPFPLPYEEDFAEYPSPLTGRMAKFLADQSGAWEASDNVLRQVATQAPGANQWACNSEPFTEVGDVNWTDYVVSATARLPESGYAAVCARVSRYTGFHCGEVPGYCLKANASGWTLLSAGPLAAAPKVLAEGRINADSARLEVRVRGTLVQAFIDGRLLASARSSASLTGLAALASGWHAAEFDDLAIKQLQPAAPLKNAFRSIGLFERDWGKLSFDAVPRDIGRGPRTDYSGCVGMRVRIVDAVTLTALGRWRFDDDANSHSLTIVGNGKTILAVLQPTVPPDDAGFAWSEVNETQLEPGVYDIVSEELANGDRWLDEGLIVEEEGWLEVLSSVYGPSPAALQPLSPHTTYGPVSVRIRSSPPLLQV